MLGAAPNEPGAVRIETIAATLRQSAASVPQLATMSASASEGALSAAPNGPGAARNEAGGDRPGIRQAWDMSEVMTWDPDAHPESG